MADRGFRHWFFLLIVALAFAGCSPPFGNIGERSVSPPPPPAAVANGIEAGLNRSTNYTQGVSFRRSHLQVYAKINGVPDYQQSISPDLCDIFIKETSSTEKPFVGEGYELTVAGQTTIRVKHKTLGFEASISITVAAQTGGGNQGPRVGWGWETPD